MDLRTRWIAVGTVVAAGFVAGLSALYDRVREDARLRTETLTAAPLSGTPAVPTAHDPDGTMAPEGGPAVAANGSAASDPTAAVRHDPETEARGPDGDSEPAAAEGGPAVSADGTAASDPAAVRRDPETEARGPDGDSGSAAAEGGPAAAADGVAASDPAAVDAAAAAGVAVVRVDPEVEARGPDGDSGSAAAEGGPAAAADGVAASDPAAVDAAAAAGVAAVRVDPEVEARGPDGDSGPAVAADGSAASAPAAAIRHDPEVEARGPDGDSGSAAVEGEPAVAAAGSAASAPAAAIRRDPETEPRGPEGDSGSAAAEGGSPVAADGSAASDPPNPEAAEDLVAAGGAELGTKVGGPVGRVGENPEPPAAQGGSTRPAAGPVPRSEPGPSNDAVPAGASAAPGAAMDTDEGPAGVAEAVTGGETPEPVAAESGAIRPGVAEQTAVPEIGNGATRVAPAQNPGTVTAEAGRPEGSGRSGKPDLPAAGSEPVESPVSAREPVGPRGDGRENAAVEVPDHGESAVPQGGDASDSRRSGTAANAGRVEFPAAGTAGGNRTEADGETSGRRRGARQTARVPEPGIRDSQPRAGAGPPVDAPPPDPVPDDLVEFDVVQIARDGTVVVAGRTRAGARVELMVDGDFAAAAEVTGRGEFVLVPEMPLSPGVRELSVAVRSSEDRQTASRIVVVLVPDRELLAARAAAAAEPPPPDAPVALLVDEQGETVGVIQPAPRVNGSGPALSLTAVTFDQDGYASIAGRGRAGQRITVFLDNVAAGSAVIGEDGSWTVRVGRPLSETGSYELRMDQTGADDDGVTERIVTTLVRAGGRLIPASATVVTVEKGMTLWGISRRHYGRGILYTLIYDSNSYQIADPHWIYPDQKFLIPDRR